jgi:hypothetical protein
MIHQLFRMEGSVRAHFSGRENAAKAADRCGGDLWAPPSQQASTNPREFMKSMDQLTACESAK